MSRGETAERVVRRPPFGAPHVFVLAVIDGEDQTIAHRISKAETVLGRGDEADLRLDDDLVSQRHCLIRADAAICTIVDLGSRNGTQVNGRRLRDGVAHRIRNLDEIRVGGTSLFVLAGCFKQGGRSS